MQSIIRQPEVAGSFHVALTGHRPGKLAGYDLYHPFYERLRERLKGIVLDGIEKHSHLTLHSGMALGADTIWSQAALTMRHQPTLPSSRCRRSGSATEA